MKHLARLREQIDDLRYRYHVLNDPEVTDAMYDGLMDELRKIEAAHPELITPDSPTQRVAGEPLAQFGKIVHTVPQWSFNDAFTEEDLRNWQERILDQLEKQLGSRPKDISYTAELKIDGLHMVLTYKEGQLESAATRGNGKVGEDVTQNIRTIETVPLRLKKPVSIVAEGEVWMHRQMFATINAERKAAGEPLFANPRNAAAGTIRQLDSRIVAARKLALTAYDISLVSDDALLLKTQEDELRSLKELGFLTDTNWRVCKTMDEILAIWHEWESKRDSEPFWIDGIVVKVNQKQYQDLLGFTGKAPRFAIALKFAAEQGTTRIKDIYVQVGRTGALTPVALMEPVALAGTTVTHATLHNFDEITRLDVRVGDTVVVEKAGDIIPKVVRVLEKMRSGSERVVQPPTTCPICNAPVSRTPIQEAKKSSAGMFCTNPRCYAQERERMIHFVSKKAFDIDGLGEKIIEQLIQVGLIKNPADIFVLTQGDLEPLERFATKSAENLIRAIDDAKQITLARFLFALGIRHVGEETAIRLAEHFGTWENILAASCEDFELVPDVGPTVATSLFAYLHNKQHRAFLEALLKNGVVFKKQTERLVTSSGPLIGKTVVVTGTLGTISREEAKEKIRKAGGHVASSVSKKTDYVVVGENPGSKYNLAKQLQIPCLSEAEFFALLKN